MINEALTRLVFLVDTIPSLLSQIKEPGFSLKPNPEKFSKKEIIGHLIDSAANNHQRFIRGQFEDNPAITYNADKWVQFNYYHQIDGDHIINLWKLYNKQLIEVIKRIPRESLNRRIKIDDNLCSLDFLIQDYVQHMEHHLREVIDY